MNKGLAQPPCLKRWWTTSGCFATFEWL